MFRGGVLTISDKGSIGERIDTSGPAAHKRLEALSIDVKKYEVVPDSIDSIAAKLIEWADIDCLDIVVTTGGTGLSPRDVTPEKRIPRLRINFKGLFAVSLASGPNAVLVDVDVGSGALYIDRSLRGVN